MASNTNNSNKNLNKIDEINVPKRKRQEPTNTYKSSIKEFRCLRRLLRDARNPFVTITDEHFIRTFLFPKHLCKQLIDEISPILENSQRINATPCHMKVLSALRFYASGSLQRALGQDDWSVLSQASYSRCVTDITAALNRIAHRHIQFPKVEKFAQRQNKFFEKHGFPGVIGLLKTTHVRINQPFEVELAYYCRQNDWFSKKVLFVCDDSNLILSTNANFGGSYQDNIIWQQTKTCQYLQELHMAGIENFWLLGSKAFALQPWLMTPFLIPETAAEQEYNERHEATYNNCCIRLLKSRFQCLNSERGLFYSPFKSGQIINACMVLHNMLVRAKIPFHDKLNECDIIADDIYQDGDSDIDLLLKADEIRCNIMQHGFQDFG